jgi:hypothetical protein
MRQEIPDAPDPPGTFVSIINLDSLIFMAVN